MGRREANKAKKRAALLAAGRALFLEHGAASTSVEQLASHAGVARGTFYLYFENKDALFDAVIDELFVPLAGVLGDVERDLRAAETPEACLAIYQVMAARIVALGLQQKEVVLLVFQEMRGRSVPGLRPRERALIEQITRMTRLAMDRGLVREGDARLASLMILGAIERLYYEVLTGELPLRAPGAMATEATVMLSRILGLDLELPPIPVDPERRGPVEGVRRSEDGGAG